MSTHPATASAGIVTRLSPPGRLIGFDAARGLALLTMMVTHIFPLSDDAGAPTFAALFSGRSSALFAVLAGCSLVLSTRGTMEATGRMRDAVPGVLVRAASIVVIGLFLGTISTYLAVILVNYGVMFALALLVLRLRAPMLFLLAGAWMVLSPIASMLIRSGLGLEPSYLPMSWLDLATPVTMATDLFLTGYYPVLQWMSYIILGMAIAKTDVRKRLYTLIAVGIGLFALGRGISQLILASGGRTELEAVAALYGTDLNAALTTTSYGVTPTTSWWWLTIAGPHSATPFDLISTAGTSMAAIGVCQLAATLLKRHSWLLAPLSAPGSMPLTVYAIHVTGVQFTHPIFQPEPMIGTPDPSRILTEFLIFAIGLTVFAIVWKLAIGPRGPLESIVASLVRAVGPDRPDQPGLAGPTADPRRPDDWPDRLERPGDGPRPAPPAPY